MIKFFCALYGLDSKANSVFEIERIQRYFGFSQKRHESQQFSGAMFQDQWYVPQGDSWGSISKMLKLIIYGETRVLEVHPAF
jgi:iron complex transport system substrate-binding protein